MPPSLLQGQVSFLSTVDPKLLKGYTVEFFTSVTSTESAAALKMEAIAKTRGISAIVHRHSMGRLELLRRLCRAKALLHYASEDANPRAVYEAFLAGLPALITRCGH